MAESTRTSSTILESAPRASRAGRRGFLVIVGGDGDGRSEARDDAALRRVGLLVHIGAGPDRASGAIAFTPDVVVVDCMMDAGLEAARMLALPSAVLVHVAYRAFMHEWGDGAGRADKARYLDEAGAVLALVPPGFDTPCPLPPNTRYVGPITDPKPVRPLDPRDAGLLAEPGDPWVLLSLSTTSQGQAAALPPMLDAVAALPVRVLLTLGGALPASAVDPPLNVTVRGFVPHQLVLPHMAAVISHGGLSTITAALTAGVPLLCIPQGRDQSDNAERVAASGVGRALATSAPPAQITRAPQELLADPAALSKARRFADVIDGLGGGDAATRKVAGLARSGAPIGPGQAWSTARLSATWWPGNTRQALTQESCLVTAA